MHYLRLFFFNSLFIVFFFYKNTTTTEIYTLSLHDALPICKPRNNALPLLHRPADLRRGPVDLHHPRGPDRKSTRLNSSHLVISYAVFCLKKKNDKIL